MYECTNRSTNLKKKKIYVQHSYWMKPVQKSNFGHILNLEYLEIELQWLRPPQHHPLSKMCKRTTPRVNHYETVVS